MEVTRPVLERYQRYLFHYRKKNGEPLSFRASTTRLVPLRVWFKWMARQNHILHNPASELELPRLGHPLAQARADLAEVEQVMMQPNIADPLGLRDRAILEMLYSTGMRRLELVNLKLYDLRSRTRHGVIRQGKGKKDRMIPIGERAAAWVEKYLREARPQTRHRTRRRHGVPDRAGRAVQPRPSDLRLVRALRGRRQAGQDAERAICSATRWRR